MAKRLQNSVYCKFYANLPDNKKTKKLLLYLKKFGISCDFPDDYVCLILLKLTNYCHENDLKDGDFGHLSDWRITSIAGWEGIDNPTKFVEAIALSGFVIRGEKDGLRVLKIYKFKEYNREILYNRYGRTAGKKRVNNANNSRPIEREVEREVEGLKEKEKDKKKSSSAKATKNKNESFREKLFEICPLPEKFECPESREAMLMYFDYRRFHLKFSTMNKKSIGILYRRVGDCKDASHFVACLLYGIAADVRSPYAKDRDKHTWDTIYGAGTALCDEYPNWIKLVEFAEKTVSESEKSTGFQQQAQQPTRGIKTPEDTTPARMPDRPPPVKEEKTMDSPF